MRILFLIIIGSIIPVLLLLKHPDNGCTDMIRRLNHNMWPVPITDQLYDRYCKGTGKVKPHRYNLKASMITVHPEPLILKNKTRREKIIAINTRLANSNIWYLYKQNAINVLKELEINGDLYRR